jgi:molybdate transport system substrate-binding protein
VSGPSRRSALTGLLLAAGLLAGVACSPAPAASPPPPLTVFAAASLTDAFSELAGVYGKETGQAVRLSFAASGQVARQVEAGAPADIVILADRPWMDRLAASGRIAAGSRLDLLGNRLVLVAAPDARIEGEPLDWLDRTGGKLVIGDPDSVPAGAYARDWLKKVGRWDGLQSSLVTAADVRSVRGFVARGEAQLGVVYRSDATGFAGVRVVQEPPAAEQPDIAYPAALTPTALPAATAFLHWLRTPEAGTVFRRHGFEPLS